MLLLVYFAIFHAIWWFVKLKKRAVLQFEEFWRLIFWMQWLANFIWLCIRTKKCQSLSAIWLDYKWNLHLHSSDLTSTLNLLSPKSYVNSFRHLGKFNPCERNNFFLLLHLRITTKYLFAFAKKCVARFESRFLLFSDLTCGPLTTTTTTTRTTTTTTRSTTPKPLPPLRVSRPPSRTPSRDPPRRRVGFGRNDLSPGDIVTEIKMNVGQNGPNAEQRYKTFGPQQVPKPIDVASAPLPGLPRGPPIASNIVTRTSDNDKPRSVPTATLTVQDQDEPRPSNIVMRPTRIETQETSEAKLVANDEVIVRDAYKEDNSIVIKWDTDTSNILGFRIVYRLFGKPEFKQGPPLAPSEREFRIKNVPSMVSKDRVIDSQRQNWYLKWNLCFSGMHRGLRHISGRNQHHSKFRSIWSMPRNTYRRHWCRKAARLHPHTRVGGDCGNGYNCRNNFRCLFENKSEKT